MEILNKKRGFLSGNDGVVRGALESGIGCAFSYPGTPATEIGEVFAEVAKETGIYFEWSVNEKIALEAAAGAAFSGVKSIVSVKHYGLNVALDSLLPLAYLSCPLVVVVTDDPGCFSSIQTEQDSRWFSKLGKIPILEPSNSQEAKEMTKEAFKIAWQYKIPVILRMSTRVCYSRSLVDFGLIIKPAKGKFKKFEFKLGAARTVELHKNILEKISEIGKLSESSKLNFIEKSEGMTGIITSGVTYEYVKEVLEKLNLKLPILKIGLCYPFPEKLVKSFLKNVCQAIVIEELDPFIEEEIRKIDSIKIHGKDVFSETGEIKPEQVLEGIAKILGITLPKPPQIEVEKRLSFLCPGCPHRSTLYAVKKVLGRKIFSGDIGCSMLGIFSPLEMQDFVVSMGASVGIGHGISKTTGEKPVIFIGDSAFFHAGMPALLNLVYNKADALVIIVDNRWTAMTGHQPNPNTGINAMQEEAKSVDIAEIAKALKADFVKSSNVYSFDQLCNDIKEAYAVKGVSVLVANGECRLVVVRNAARKGIMLPKFEIVKQDSKLEELKNFGCPAIQKEDGKWFIDKDICWGCTVCKQIVPSCIEISK